MRLPNAARPALALGVVAVAVRAAGAALRPAWHDEYFTAWAAQLPLAELLDALALDSGPPLPYLLARLGALLGLPALLAGRAVSVLAGTAAVLLAARAATRAFGERAGRWTGWLLAFHPLSLAWSSEARAYALLLLAVAWGWERLEAARAGERAALGLGLAVALGCWSHGLGSLLAATLATTALALPAPARRTALPAIGAGLASHAPWLPVAFHQPPAATAWMVTAWRSLPPLEQALAPVRLLPPLAPFGRQLDLPSAPLLASLAAAALLALLVLRSRREPRVWMLALLPAGGLLGLALLGVPALYPGRAEVLTLLPVLALAGAGAARGRAGAAAAGLLVASAAVMTGATLAAWQRRPQPPEALLARTIQAALPNGGAVVAAGYWRLGLWYHLGPAYPIESVPAVLARHPGWHEPATDSMQPGELERLAVELRPPFALVLAPELPSATALDRLARERGLRPAAEVPGALLYLPAPGAQPIR